MVGAMVTPLAQRHCEVCTPDTSTLSRQDIDKQLQEVPGWMVEETDGHLTLARRIKFKGFMPGVELVNRIAALAEEEGHHPDLHLTYGSLTINLWTHAAGGLTDNDRILAAKINQIRPA